jgi:molybdenum cofactor biosynthesis protein B
MGAHRPGGPHEHKQHAPVSVACHVVTSSDTRDEASDHSGRLIRELLGAEGHRVVGYQVIKDEASALREALDVRAPGAGAQAVLVNGGTGIGKRDSTYDTLAPLLEKRLDGFGELFRFLSFAEIGSAAMMSRAVAGTYRGMIVFAMPGSTGAVRLAMERLVLPELGHALRELSR